MIQGQVLAEGDVLINQVSRTNNIVERTRGLLGRPRLRTGQAYLLDPCSAIHTFGMRYALDLIFADREGRVLKLVRALKPMRVSMCWKARWTLEMPAGEIDRLGLTTGMRLQWSAR